ncbi:MAG: acylphosphatase [Desulfobacterales bacterium]
MNRTRAHVMISGRVQGVFFRVETRETALRKEVTGWVRNTRDGRVEAVFEGNDEEVQQMIQWCRKGPPGARVNHVDIEQEEFRNEFDTFSVRH